MLCVKCGSFMTDDTQVCPLCGSPAGNVPEEALLSEEDVLQNATPEVFDLSESDGKKKLRLPLLIGAAVVLAVAVVMIILNFGAVRGFVLRGLCSPKNVMTIALNDSVQQTMELVSMLADDHQADGYSCQLHVKPGQTVTALLSQLMGGSDTSWLSDISLSCRSSVGENTAGNSFTLSLKDTPVVSASHVMDSENDRHYLLLPEVSQTPLSGKLEPAQQLMSCDQLLKSLPSKGVLTALCDRYITLCVQGFTRVELTKSVLTAGDISQKLFVLEARINETDLIYLMMDVLEKLMVDEEFKAILEQLQPVLDDLLAEKLDEQAVIGYGSLQDRFIEQAKQLIEQLRSELYGADPANEIVLYLYLNSSNHIVGSKLEITGMEQPVYDAYFVVKGAAFASYLDASGLQASGSGSYQDGLTGNLMVSITEQELIKLSYSDVQFHKGSFTGQMELRPAPSFMKLITQDMPLEAAQLLTISDIALKTNWEYSKPQCLINTDLLWSNSSLLALAFSGQSAPSETIQIPEASVDMEDQQAMVLWRDQADFSTVRRNLITAGVPEQLFGIIAFLQAFSS